MSEKSPHRCGPGFFPEPLRAILSIPFNDSCTIHDDEYGKGERDQGEIDREFLQNMKEQAGWNPFLWVLAHMYYLGARLGVIVYARRMRREVEEATHAGRA